jgi:uncharacterized small protein (DUF1192 family)
MAPPTKKSDQPNLEFITITKPTTVGIDTVTPGKILSIPGECSLKDAKVLIGVGKAVAGKKEEEAAELAARWKKSRERGARDRAARAGGGENMLQLIEAVASLTASVAALQSEISEMKAAQTPPKAGK